DAVGGAGLALELVVQAGHDLQQGRLTRAVDPDDADLGVVVEAEPDVLEDLLAAGIGLGQALHLEDILLRHASRRAFDSVRMGSCRGMSRPRRLWATLRTPTRLFGGGVGAPRQAQWSLMELRCSSARLAGTSSRSQLSHISTGPGAGFR